MRKVSSVVLVLCPLIVIAGCSSNPEPAKNATQATTAPVEKKEAVLYTGKPCFMRMVDQARRWTIDAMPIHLESKLNAESVGHDGKATIWTATFVSPSKGSSRIFTCSGSVLPQEAAMGVSGSPEMTASTAVPMFDPSLLGVDTDDAFKVAQEKGGAKLIEKDSKQPIIYALDWDGKNKQLVWSVVYGSDAKNSKGVGVIDARTGKFLRASK